MTLGNKVDHRKMSMVKRKDLLPQMALSVCNQMYYFSCFARHAGLHYTYKVRFSTFSQKNHNNSKYSLLHSIVLLFMAQNKFCS